jgi:hypothetical protein
MPDMTEIAEQNAEALAPAETEAPDEVQAAWDAASKAAEPEAAAAEVEKPADDPEERINSVLRAREEAHKKRLEAEDYAARMRKDAETQAEKIREEARAEARRIAAEELAAERAKWRSSPAATARALAGGDVDSFVQGILKEGTPEYAAEQARQKELAELREDAKVGKSSRQPRRNRRSSTRCARSSCPSTPRRRRRRTCTHDGSPKRCSTGATPSPSRGRKTASFSGRTLTQRRSQRILRSSQESGTAPVFLDNHPRNNLARVPLRRGRVSPPNLRRTACARLRQRTAPSDAPLRSPSTA